MSQEENKHADSSSIMKLIEFLGINPSSVIKWLSGLIVSAFIGGYGLCHFVLSTKHEVQIIKMQTEQQRALTTAENKGKDDAYEEQRRQAENVKQINSIVLQAKDDDRIKQKKD